MKKFVISFLLIGLLVPSLGLAQTIPNLAGILPGTAGDVLTGWKEGTVSGQSIQQLRLRLNQLFALLNVLDAILKQRRAQEGTPVTTVTDPAQPDSNRIKVGITGLKTNYNLGENITFSISAKQKENGPSVITVPTACPVKYIISLEGGAKPIIYDSTTNQVCGTATSSISLLSPLLNTWAHTWPPITYTNNLPLGGYRLTAEVVGYAKTAEWHFNVKRPLASTITLTAPLSNQIWATSTPYTVEWTSLNTAITDKTEIILITPGSEYIPLAGGVAGTPNDGSQSVSLPAHLMPGTYLLFVRVTNSGQVVNSTQVQIVIPEFNRPVNTPFINSLNPISGLVGSSVVITGTSFTSDSNVVSFGTTALGTVVSANGIITITVPNVAVGAYQIKVTNGNGISNLVAFNVLAAAPNVPISTAITITSPVGDTVEEWVANSIKTITWDTVPTVANGGASKVNVKLVDPLTNVTYTIAFQITNTGSFTWQAGKLTDGSSVTGKYRIRVCPVGLGECDRSNKNIKIVAATTAVSVDNPQLASTAAVLQALIEQLNALLRLR